MIEVNNKIGMIKLVREMTGFDLKRAKDLVEALVNKADPFIGSPEFNSTVLTPFEREFVSEALKGIDWPSWTADIRTRILNKLI